MDRGAWRAAVHGVAKSQTRLSTKLSTAQAYGKVEIHLPIVYPVSQKKRMGQRGRDANKILADFNFSFQTLMNNSEFKTLNLFVLNSNQIF